MTSKYYKHPQYGHIYCGELVTPQGNICWPGGLSKPKDAPPAKEGEKQGAPRYEGTLILEKKDPKVIKFVKELETTAKEAIGLFNKGRNMKMGDIDCVFGKYGDGDAWDLEKYPYYKGHWVMVARNAEQPQVVDNKREKLDPATIKGGMHARFVATPLITAHGMSFKLLVVQKFDGEYQPIAGGAREVMSLLEDLEAEESNGDGNGSKKPDSNESSESASEAQETSTKAPPPATGKKGKGAAVNLLA